jgi:ABC-type multidrug transport system permease subunit
LEHNENIDSDKSIKEIQQKNIIYSYYAYIGMIFGLIIFFILDSIREGEIQFEYLNIYIIGETIVLFYKYIKEKRNSYLLLGIVCIIIIISGFILYL